jgi:hypothetical protein
MSYEVTLLGPHEEFWGFKRGVTVKIDDAQKAKSLSNMEIFEVLDQNKRMMGIRAINKTPGQGVAVNRVTERTYSRFDNPDSLTPSGSKRSVAPVHDPGYVPGKEAGDLPPVGFEIVDGEPERMLAHPQSQRDVSAGVLGEVRLPSSERGGLAFNADANIKDVSQNLKELLSKKK